MNRDRTVYVCSVFLLLGMSRSHSVVVQGKDANDFNPDRFLGRLPAELADTKDGALFTTTAATEYS